MGADPPASSDPEPGSALVVDVANVMGSRPDGWWKDRAGAASRLLSELSSADLDYSEVVAVLEGRSRGASAAEGVLVVLASGSGDDAILEEAAARVSAGVRVDVVTADRGLQARVEAAGASVLRPSWLLARLGS